MVEPTPEPLPDELPSMVSPNYFAELGKQFLNTPLSEFTASWIPTTSDATTLSPITIGPFSTVFPPKATTQTLQYDGPSNTVYIALHKGEHLTVTPDMEPIIQRLRDEGHEFSTVD